MSNWVPQPIRLYICGIYKYVRPFFEPFCGLPPFLRRLCGGLLLYSTFYFVYRMYNSRKLVIPVKVHVLVSGETFRTHETLIKKLNLQIEPCSAESSSVILLFCPVVSRIGTDMEAAMARVTENKPVILVFMHHCHSASHMTNITVQPSRNNIVQVVHCAFLENEGLLQCRENDQAVSEVRMMLQKYQHTTTKEHTRLSIEV